MIHESLDGNAYFGMKTLATRVKFTMHYDPEPFGMLEKSTDLETKHAIFSESVQFNLTIEQYQSLESVYDGLLKINSPESLKMFIASFESTSAEMRGVNQGQLNLARQNLKMQNLMSESFDLASALEEMGIRSEGNEELM